MNLFSKETGIRLAVVNVLLFCVLLFTLYYAEEHNIIDLLSDSSPNKLTDEELSQMKKHSELENLRNILLLGELTYDLEDEMCKGNVFFIKNDSIESSIHETNDNLLNGEMVFVHNPVDKIGDNEYLIRQYDQRMPDNAGEPFLSFPDASREYFEGTIFTGKIVKTKNEPVFCFETSKDKSKILPGQIIRSTLANLQIAIYYDQYHLPIYLPYHLKFQRLVDFNGEFIDINPYEFTSTEKESIFHREDTLMMNYNRNEVQSKPTIRLISRNKAYTTRPFCEDEVISLQEKEANNTNDLTSFLNKDLYVGLTDKWTDEYQLSKIRYAGS
ncbi:Oidioi.mRNA.OKI2018_I69.chr2.g5335.t1.cds [Oikopleura dioica]|uniref:Oidioi.mRNA.OKI2018_I69.chr2.g5335.t1.cds n=1 Tax=Oikopleura dioica TaxID=34765 RepID=A0ABN7T5N3_OIKDI|nr:Oidioi.mRNA.OKI2018_I69.chr2.g5335.t1.cds [Oikopleura dioica]